MFDERTEELAKEIGLEICFPPAALRNRLDNKIETVRVGNRAGVPSVPNALAKVSCYRGFMQRRRGRRAWRQPRGADGVRR